MKPIAKSLHTVTVLTAIAKHLDRPVFEVLSILNLDGKPDPYGLVAASQK